MWLVVKDIILHQQNKTEQFLISEKQEKTKVKKLSLNFFKKRKVKVNLLKVKLIINMLYIFHIQFNFSNLVLRCCRQLMFFTAFLYRC